MYDTLIDFLQSAKLASFLKAGALVLVGLLAARLLSSGLYRLMLKHTTPHHCTLMRRLVYWLVLSLFIASALRELGFSLGVLLGAAGILSVAVGFASQTSASNLISGLFLVGEKPFELGDVIQVGTTRGEVLSIDLLSVKLRTYDNLYVRIPNESLIKTDMINLTRFPIRRFDMRFKVSYTEDIARLREVLAQVARNTPLCLEEPEPMFLIEGMGDSAVNIQYSVWAKRENYRDLRNEFQEKALAAFMVADIEVSIPKRALYAGKESGSFPVQMIQKD